MPFGDSNTQTNDGLWGETARINYFGRAMYDYDNKYMLQFQFRYDGSQNFPKGNRYGFSRECRRAGLFLAKHSCRILTGWII